MCVHEFSSLYLKVFACALVKYLSVLFLRLFVVLTYWVGRIPSNVQHQGVMIRQKALNGVLFCCVFNLDEISLDLELFVGRLADQHIIQWNLPFPIHPDSPLNRGEGSAETGGQISMENP